MHGLALSLAGGVEARSLPAPTAAFELEVSLPVARFGRLGFAAVATLPQQSRIPLDDAEATLHLYAARFTAGVEHVFGIASLGAFSVAELGVTGGQGQGVDVPESAWTAWAALGLGVSAGVYAGSRLAIMVEGDARVPLWRPAFVFEGGPGEVHQAGAIAFRGALRLRVHLQ